MTLAGKTIHGVRITLMATTGAAVLQAGVIAVLARLIAPAEYGVVIAALVVLRPVTDVLGSAIEKMVVLPGDLPDSSVATWYRMALLGGGGLTLLLAALALLALPLVGASARMLALMAPLTIPVAVGAVSRGLLRRRFGFAQLAMIDTVGLVANGAVAAVATLTGWGALALVAGQWAQWCVQAALGLGLCGHRLPSLGTVTGPVLTPIGEGVSKSAILDLFIGQAPFAMIGAVLGAAPLGLFSRVYVLVYLPIESVVNAMTRVSLTGFSQSRIDGERLRRGAGALVEAAGAAVLPLCAGTALAGTELVAVALGPQWAEAAPLTPWLCAAGAATVLSQTFAVVAEAALKLDTRVRIQAGVLVFRVLVLAIALPFGMTAAVAAMAVASLLLAALNGALATRALEWPTGRALALLTPGLSAGVACLAWVAFAGRTLPPDLAPSWRLAADITGCGLATLLVYRGLFPNLLDKLLAYAGFIPKRA